MTKSSRAEDSPKYDLGERSAVFAEAVVEFSMSVRFDAVSDPLVRQFIRAATSIGANYCEAEDGGSRKEFRYRISLCRRESRETMYWCRVLAKALPERADDLRPLWKEADELNRIFGKIFQSTKPSNSE